MRQAKTHRSTNGQKGTEWERDTQAEKEALSELFRQHVTQRNSFASERLPWPFQYSSPDCISKLLNQSAPWSFQVSVPTLKQKVSIEDPGSAITWKTVHGEVVYLPGKWHITSLRLKSTKVSGRTTLADFGEKRAFHLRKVLLQKMSTSIQIVLINIVQTGVGVCVWGGGGSCVIWIYTRSIDCVSTHFIHCTHRSIKC